MDFDTKLKTFSKYSSHELNFFLFKKDREFFDKVVKELISNKLQKTFVDYYLLESTDKVVEYLDKSFLLNKFE